MKWNKTRRSNNNSCILNSSAAPTSCYLTHKCLRSFGIALRCMYAGHCHTNSQLFHFLHIHVFICCGHLFSLYCLFHSIYFTMSHSIEHGNSMQFFELDIKRSSFFSAHFTCGYCFMWITLFFALFCWFLFLMVSFVDTNYSREQCPRQMNEHELNSFQ